MLPRTAKPAPAVWPRKPFQRQFEETTLPPPRRPSQAEWTFQWPEFEITLCAMTLWLDAVRALPPM